MIVCLDTNIIIYLVEHNAVWTPKALARFNASLKAREEIVVCDAARVECLIKPLASKNLADEARFRAFFGNPLVRMLPVSTATWDHAARIGATFGLKALDSVHLATAIEHGCDLFLTNDVQLARCTGITVEVLT